MAGGDHLVDGFRLCRLPGGFAQEAGGGGTRELVADEEVVKRLIVEMGGIVPSRQKLAERIGFLVAGQREFRVEPDDAVPEQGSGTAQEARSLSDSNGPSPGSTDAAAWQRTGRTSIGKPRFDW